MIQSIFLSDTGKSKFSCDFLFIQYQGWISTIKLKLSTISEDRYVPKVSAINSLLKVSLVILNRTCNVKTHEMSAGTACMDEETQDPVPLIFYGISTKSVCAKRTQMLNMILFQYIVLPWQVYKHNCVKCEENFLSRPAVLEHMEKAQHFSLPEDKTVWDQPQ